MKNLSVSVSGWLANVLGLIVMLSGTQTSPPDPGLTIDGRCIRVLDGDTIEVEYTRTARIRLIGCWAPETRGGSVAEKNRGLKSKARMVQLVEGKAVRVSIPLSADLGDSTTMSRVLGRVWINNDGVPESRDLSERMVSEGLATKNKEGSK